MREETLTQPAAFTFGSGPGTWHIQSHRSVTVKGKDEQGHISKEPTTASCFWGWGGDMRPAVAWQQQCFLPMMQETE